MGPGGLDLFVGTCPCAILGIQSGRDSCVRSTHILRRNLFSFLFVISFVPGLKPTGDKHEIHRLAPLIVHPENSLGIAPTPP